MQTTVRAPGQPAPVKIYNAVYSSVQVYECMVRGIAVMRRRADSYVNATQILKVAGVDKGRRTKILEKEILPGKHEIVQGGYGKYQGTWIPLERGRDIALQYGVAPLLAPLFDFVPNTSAIGALPPGLQPLGGSGAPRPLSGAATYPSLGGGGGFAPGGLAPPPIMPGSALRLLNQGRAQGLFTPSTSTLGASRPAGYASPAPYYSGYGQAPFGALTGVSPTPPPLGSHPSSSSLKRTRSDADGDVLMGSMHSTPVLGASPDMQLTDRSRPASAAPPQDHEGPSPTKRARTESSLLSSDVHMRPATPGGAQAYRQVRSSSPALNGQSRPFGSAPGATNGKAPQVAEPEVATTDTRSHTKPSLPRTVDYRLVAKDPKRGAIAQMLYRQDDPQAVLEALRGLAPDVKDRAWDVDLVLDDMGHTALHLAASLARPDTVHALIAAGADMHRGNYDGETPLMRATLATDNFTLQKFEHIVAALHASIRTLDISRKSVLHHIVSCAGVRGRASSARYYLDQILLWVAQHQGGDFKNLVDLQDVHGDTALNIAARVGNRALVRALLDVGANKSLPNKLGLRPGDFGVETEELSTGSRTDDLLSSIRTAPTGPVQKTQSVLTELENMINGLTTDFTAEMKAKQDALDVSQAHLRAATRELSEQRKQISIWQAQCNELDLVAQRSKNLERALEEEVKFDWTGRTDVDGSDGGITGGPAFRKRGAAPNASPTATATATTTGPEAAPAQEDGNATEPTATFEDEPPIPTEDSTESLIRLRRMVLWNQRMEVLLKQRLHALEGASTEREFQCKKIVALCTGVPVDKVEDMLEGLLVAVESETQSIDISRVSGFMQKVSNGAV